MQQEQCRFVIHSLSVPCASGNWLNQFMADFQVTNPSNERLAVTDITGHYMNEGMPLAEASLAVQARDTIYSSAQCCSQLYSDGISCLC